MTVTQLHLFPIFRTLPLYDESDERSHSIAVGVGKSVRECATLAEVEDCLKNPKLVPLGGITVGKDGRQVVVVYFAEAT